LREGDQERNSLDKDIADIAKKYLASLLLSASVFKAKSLSLLELDRVSAQAESSRGFVRISHVQHNTKARSTAAPDLS